MVAMKNLTNRRQRIRWAMILISFFLFPVTLYYFSPYLIVVGAAEGVISGSAVLFTALFLSGLFFGRGFCAWICPGAGIQEACYGACTRSTALGWPRLIKYPLWGIWAGTIIWLFFKVGGVQSVQPIYHTANGISVDDPDSFMRYLSIAGSILLMGLFISRRAFCHTLCWMAPFLVIGEKVGRWLRLPRLSLRADPANCNGCFLCTKNCPMDLPVDVMAAAGDMRHIDCINCGRCVDICNQNAIQFSWRERPPRTR